MSGGYFEYAQYKIIEIYSDIEMYLQGRELDRCEVEEIINCRWESDEVKAYVKKHKHSIPNPHGYSRQTLREFRKAVSLLKRAYVYTQRIDYLLEGDDGEESFHRRLKEELEELKTKTKNNKQ